MNVGRRNSMVQRLSRSTIALAVAVFLLSGQRAAADVIGPDAFGYSATNDVPFTFIDISATGTRTLAGPDDITVSGVGIGFSFNFYGTNYTTINYNTNALIQFGGITSEFTNVDLTTTSPNLNLLSIAPF